MAQREVRRQLSGGKCVNFCASTTSRVPVSGSAKVWKGNYKKKGRDSTRQGPFFGKKCVWLFLLFLGAMRNFFAALVREHFAVKQ